MILYEEVADHSIGQKDEKVTTPLPYFSRSQKRC